MRTARAALDGASRRLRRSPHRPVTGDGPARWSTHSTHLPATAAHKAEAPASLTPSPLFFSHNEPAVTGRNTQARPLAHLHQSPPDL